MSGFNPRNKSFQPPNKGRPAKSIHVISIDLPLFPEAPPTLITLSQRHRKVSIVQGSLGKGEEVGIDWTMAETKSVKFK